MIAYVDASVLLRVVLGQRDSLPEWRQVETAISSALVEVECLRTLDRLRIRHGVADADLALRRETVYRLIAAMKVVEITRPILVRAAHPLPTTLGTLDAIHLATALAWRESTGADLTLATHDLALAIAGRASGLRVVGV